MRKNRLGKEWGWGGKKRFPFVLFLILLGICYIDQWKWTGSINYNPDINGKSLAGFGIFGLNKDPSQKISALNRDKFSRIKKASDIVPTEKVVVITRTIGKKVGASDFHSVTVDDDNTKWFITESGIVSFNGKKWNLHNRNKKIPQSDIKDIAYMYTQSDRHIWLATPEGVTLASLPVSKRDPANTYNADNSPLLSNNVVSVAAGRNLISWIGTDKGISAVRNNKWLDYSYRTQYPEELFSKYPITQLAASIDGDSLYVATEGIGVLRVFRDKVDAISGASEYAQWGPIDLPSDNVYSIYIAPDDTQWFGTDMGIARHVGHNTLANWTVFDTDDGLVNNFVQAIAADNEGRLWFGTKGGVSVYDGSNWISFTENNGLTSDNVLCIAVDKDGVVWIGTDNGVTSVRNGEFTQYN